MDEDMEKLMGFHDQKKEKEPIDIDDLRKQVVENAKKILNPVIVGKEQVLMPMTARDLRKQFLKIQDLKYQEHQKNNQNIQEN